MEPAIDERTIDSEIGGPVSETETIGPLPEPSPEGLSGILSPGTVLAGRYRVLELLGRGGSSLVYAVEDTELDRRCALKLLRSDRLTRAALERLRREVRLALEVSSPHLVKIYDIGRSEWGHYLTMEWVRGSTVRVLLRQAARLPVDRALAISAQVLAGLSKLHAAGIVHRDVKPENIVVAEDGSTKLVDLGIAREIDGPVGPTRTRELVGTLAYLSPEQLAHEGATPSSDLFALGLVLYEMLTGRSPAEARAAVGARSWPLIRPRTLGSRLVKRPRWLNPWLARLLAGSPASRFPDAATALAALESKRPWMRTRFDRLVAAVTLGALLLLASTAYGLWLRQRTRFSHMTYHNGEATAVASDGSVLWTLSDTRASFAWGPFGPDREERVVSVPLSALPRDTPGGRTLAFHEPGTGRTLESLELPLSPSHFTALGFGETYGAEIRTLDVDGSGQDELLITLVHQPYWPSYTVLYEPDRRRMRVIFIASGHHRPVGLMDSDEDGHNEILFSGYANRMGWHMALGLVDVIPYPGVEGRALTPMGPAETPDLDVSDTAKDKLRWYQLLPSGLCVSSGCVEIDEVGRAIRVRRRAGDGHETLSWTGFIGPPPSSIDSRQDSRRSAYDALRRAQQLLKVGAAKSSLMTAFEDALSSARNAGDRVLSEWVERDKANALVQLGSLDEADAIIRRVLENSDNPYEVAFGMGQNLHLADRLEQANAWYEMGLSFGPLEAAGRGKYEFLLGRVFALVELERWVEVEKVIAEFNESYVQSAHHTPCLKGFVSWYRDGSFTDEDCRPGAPQVLDAYRYWLLEAELERVGPREELRRRARTEAEKASDGRLLFLALEAYIRALMSDAKATEDLRLVLEELESERRRSTLARVHVKPWAARYREVFVDSLAERPRGGAE